MKKNLDIQGETKWDDTPTVNVKNHTINSGERLVIDNHREEYCSRLVIHDQAEVEVKGQAKLWIGFIKKENGEILAVNKEQIPKEQLLMCPSDSIDIRKGGQVNMREQIEQISAFTGSGKENVIYKGHASYLGLVDKESVIIDTISEGYEKPSSDFESFYGEYSPSHNIVDNSGFVDHEETPTCNVLGFVDHEETPTCNVLGFVDHVE